MTPTNAALMVFLVLVGPSALIDEPGGQPNLTGRYLLRCALVSARAGRVVRVSRRRAWVPGGA